MAILHSYRQTKRPTDYERDMFVHWAFHAIDCGYLKDSPILRKCILQADSDRADIAARAVDDFEESLRLRRAALAAGEG